jgi:hypothetical protein
VFHQVRDSRQVARGLARRGTAAPAVGVEAPVPPGDWIVKPLSSGGGVGGRGPAVACRLAATCRSGLRGAGAQSCSLPPEDAPCRSVSRARSSATPRSARAATSTAATSWRPPVTVGWDSMTRWWSEPRRWRWPRRSCSDLSASTGSTSSRLAACLTRLR